MDYQEFLKTKQSKRIDSGFDVSEGLLNSNLFDFQRHIVKTALKAGRYAIFADCGLGKTLMQLEWAWQVHCYTNKPVLILAPLAVSGQTIKEGEKFGIDVRKYDPMDVKGVRITNYEQLDKINPDDFAGVVLDESSILKNFTGKTKEAILEAFKNTPYKLACTATPSPNDELEIGNHSEFLAVMKSSEMRSLYFTTDKNLIAGNKYRLKKHAKQDFYKWIRSWAVMLSKPSDIGFIAEGYDLPSLEYHEYQIKTNKRDNGALFNDVAVSATNFNQELRQTKEQRLNKAAEIVNSSNEPYIVWIKQNEEGEYLRRLIPEAIEVKGSDSPEYKQDKLLGFANGEFRVLITKAKIAQFGLNYQHCNNQVFASLDFSFEGLYQAIRRSYRFGQTKAVNIHIITTDTMQNVINSIKDKQQKFEDMANGIIKATNSTEETKTTDLKKATSQNFDLYNGDCVEVMKELESESIDYSFFSPPFSSMYVFSDKAEDLSNVPDDETFFNHFDYVLKELYRIMKSGRLVSIHMMQGTTLKGQDGYYSIKDHRGEYIRAFQAAGFYFHGEVMIRKDPKTAAIRTKNHQLMHGTTKKDSSNSRMGLADYILTFRKDGENAEPIVNDIPFDRWCKMAEPVWLTIDESDVLEYRKARDEKDERHITATQLKPIENCILLWSNEGDTVFSPFAGVGSELYQAIIMNRKAVGVELKESYFNQCVKNCTNAESLTKQTALF